MSQREVVEFFAIREKIFSDKQGADARELAAMQPTRWITLLRKISQRAARPQDSGMLQKEIQRVIEFIKDGSQLLFSAQLVSAERWRVAGAIPLLIDIKNEDKLLEENVGFLIGAIIFEIAPAFAEVPDLNLNMTGFTELSSPPYIAECSRYSIAKFANGAGFTDEMRYIEEHGKDILGKLRTKERELVQKVQEAEQIHEEYLKDFRERSNETIAKVEQSADEKIEARLTAKQELDKISKPVDLWSKAARTHRRRFQVGLSLISLTVVVFSVGAIEYLVPALNNLGFVRSEAAQPFTPATTFTLAITAAIIAAAGFVLKIAGRFVTNALTLAEDAEVRAALADTFIGLTAEDTRGSNEDRDKARTVMLAALFRPLPGHQQEDITAPTVLSLAQDLLKKPGS